MSTGNELRAVITVDAKNAAFTIDKFVGQTVGGMGQASTAAKGATSSFSGLSGAAVVLNQGLQLVQQVARLAGAAFDLLVGGAQRTGEQYLLLSQQTGLTVEQISSLSLAAGTADVSNEALALSVKKLNINMVEAASGSKEATATFKSLGVETKNTDGSLRDVNDVFLDTIDALGSIQNDSERAAASQAVFGRSSQELAALIADGSGKIREQAELAAKLGLVWSGPAAQAADELGDQTTVLKMGLKGISDEIGSKSIPSMTGLVSATNDWIVANREAISLNIDRIFAAVGAAADVTSGAIHGVAESVSALLNLVPGLGEWLSTVKGLTVEWLDLNVQAREAAKSTNDAGRAFIDQAGKVREAKSALDQYVAGLGDSNELTADQARALTELRDTYREEQAELDRLNGALTDHVDKTEQAASATDFLVQSLSTLRDKSALTSAAQAQFAKDVGISVEEVKRLDAGGKPTAETIQKIATATGKTAAETEKALPGTRSFADGMKKTGDEATKTADKLSQLADASVQFAQSQLQQAAATGDLTRTTEAYNAAVTAAQEAYRTDIAAADAAAAAGRSKAEVDGMRTQAVQKLASATNTAAATQNAAYAREEAAQISLAQAVAQTTIAHDMDSLAMANARTVGEIYNKTVVDITTELGRQRAEIEAKRGVTLTATEADLALRQAEEQAGQQIRAAGEAAVKAASQMSDFARQVQAASDQAASAFGDLVTGIVTGQVKFQDAGKIAANIFLRGFQDVLSAQLSDAFKSVFDAAKDVIGTALGGMISTLTGGAAKSLTGMFESALGLAAGTIASSAAVFVPFVGAVGGGLALAFKNKNLGPEASIAIAADMGGAIGGASAVLLTGGALSVETLGLSAVVGAVAAGLMAAFGVDRPDMRKRIAYEVQRQLTQALGHDTDYLAALEQGLKPLGVALTPALIHTLAGASRQNDALRSQAAILADQYGADFMAGFSPAFTASISKHGASSTEVPVSDWIRAFFPDADAATQAYVQELSKSLASVEVASMGLTGADAITMTEQLAAGYVDLAQKQGWSVEEFKNFLETENQAVGMAPAFLASLDQINAGLSSQQGELDKVAAGISAAFGVPVDGSNLVDMFLQVAGSTGDATKAAEVFAQKLERMADSDPALRQILDTMDPPLVDALNNVADSAAGAAAAFQDLVGTVAADLANVVDAANLLIGNVSFEGLNDQLASLKEQLASTDDKELQQSLNAQIAAVEAQIDALSPKIDVINSQVQDSLNSLLRSAQEDGTLAVDEFTAMLQQLQILATLPAGSVSDSTQALIDSIIAQFQVALKLTDEQVADLRKQIAEGGPIVPPDVVTPPVDQQSLDDAVEGTKGVAQNSEDAAAAQQQLADAVKDVASAVTGSTDMFTALSQAAGLSSEQVQAAIQPIIGSVGDGKSLTDTQFVLDSITKFLPAEMVPAFKGSFEDASHAVSAVYTDAGNLKSALNSLVGTYPITIETTYVTNGTPPPTPNPDPGGEEGHAAGHWTVPGPIGSPYRTTVHGGEEVLSVEQSRDYRRTMRDVAMAGLDAHAAPPVTVAASSPAAPAVDVERLALAVERRLTESGRLQLLAVEAVDARQLGKRIVVTGSDEAFKSGALTGAKVKRNVARPT